MRIAFLLVVVGAVFGPLVSVWAQQPVATPYTDRARIEDFSGKLAGGIDRLEKKMDEFSGRTGLDIYIITAYKHNQPDISRIAADWPKNGNGILLGLNLHEETHWLENLFVAYTPAVTDKIPAERIGQVRDLVLLPLLEGKEITATDPFGGTKKVAFAIKPKY